MEKLNTLYVTDLDGTLLNDNSEISVESKAALNRLALAGAKITFATARTPATVVEIFKGVRLNVPGIVMTGAAMYDLNSGEYSNFHFLDHSVVDGALEVFNEYGIKPFVYVWRPDNRLHAFHVAQMNVKEEDFYRLRRDMELKKFHIDECPDETDRRHALLIFAVAEIERIKKMRDKLESKVGYTVPYYNDIFSPEFGFIEVFARGVNKWSAIMRLKTLVGADRIVAFGDNLNDIPMLENADVGVAVGNAFDDVKEKADIVIDSNNSDSVVKFIENDFFDK